MSKDEQKPARAGGSVGGPRAKTWEWQKERAEYEARRITYLGGGLAGLGLFGAGDMGATIFSEVQWLRAAFVVTAFASAACLGLGWEAARRFAAMIQRDHGDHLNLTSTWEMPTRSLWYMRLAWILLLISGLIFVAAAIWAAIRPDCG